MCAEHNLTSVRQMCLEISRVLKPRGTFIVITYGKPETSEHNSFSPVYFVGEEYIGNKSFGWALDSTTIHKPNEDNFHYVYIMIKK